MRDNPDLKDEETGTPTPYTGYVTSENDKLAKQIYLELEPSFRGYLKDIRTNRDGTRPGSECHKAWSCRRSRNFTLMRRPPLYRPMLGRTSSPPPPPPRPQLLTTTPPRPPSALLAMMTARPTTSSRRWLTRASRGPRERLQDEAIKSSLRWTRHWYPEPFRRRVACGIPLHQTRHTSTWHSSCYYKR